MNSFTVTCGYIFTLLLTIGHPVWYPWGTITPYKAVLKLLWSPVNVSGLFNVLESKLTLYSYSSRLSLSADQIVVCDPPPSGLAWSQEQAILSVGCEFESQILSHQWAHGTQDHCRDVQLFAKGLHPSSRRHTASDPGIAFRKRGR